MFLLAQNEQSGSIELANSYTDTNIAEEKNFKINETTVSNPIGIIPELTSPPTISVVEKNPRRKPAHSMSLADQSSEAILVAASNGETEVVLKLLVEKGAAIEAKDKNGRTPLICAAINGQKEVVQLLLEKDAAIEATNDSGWTPLMYAASGRHKEVLQLLLEKGANTEVKDSYDQTSLMKAAKDGHKEVVQLLLEKGADIEAKDKDGKTSLVKASRNGHKEVMQLLLDKEVKDNNGQSVRDVSDKEIGKYIREYFYKDIESTIQKIIKASDQFDGDTDTQESIENLYKQLQTSGAKLNADTIFDKLIMRIEKGVKTVDISKMRNLDTVSRRERPRFPMDKDDIIVKSVSRIVRPSSKCILDYWSQIHRDFLQLKSDVALNWGFETTRRAYIDITSKNMKLHERIRRIFIFLYDLTLKPIYILLCTSWVDLAWMLLRSDNKMTFVRPYLVKCPYVSSPSFISLLLCVEENTSDDKNIFALDFVKVSFLVMLICSYIFETYCMYNNVSNLLI